MADAPPKDLVPLKPRQKRDLQRMERIARIQDQQEEREAKILAAEHLAAQLQECDCVHRLKPEVPHAADCAYQGPGARWSKLEANVARDARKPVQLAPGYLTRIHQRALARQRAEALRPPPPPSLNVAVLVRVGNAEKGFPVVDVDLDGRLLASEKKGEDE